MPALKSWPTKNHIILHLEKTHRPSLRRKKLLVWKSDKLPEVIQGVSDRREIKSDLKTLGSVNYLDSDNFISIYVYKIPPFYTLSMSLTIG